MFSLTNNNNTNLTNSANPATAAYLNGLATSLATLASPSAVNIVNSTSLLTTSASSLQGNPANSSSSNTIYYNASRYNINDQILSGGAQSLFQPQFNIPSNPSQSTSSTSSTNPTMNHHHNHNHHQTTNNSSDQMIGELDFLLINNNSNSSSTNQQRNSNNRNKSANSQTAVSGTSIHNNYQISRPPPLTTPAVINSYNLNAHNHLNNSPQVSCTTLDIQPYTILTNSQCKTSQMTWLNNLNSKVCQICLPLSWLPNPSK